MSGAGGAVPLLAGAAWVGRPFARVGVAAAGGSAGGEP